MQCKGKYVTVQKRKKKKIRKGGEKMRQSMEDIKSIAIFGNTYKLSYSEVVGLINSGKITLEAVREKSGYKQQVDIYDEEWLEANIPEDKLGVCPMCGVKFEKERKTQVYCTSLCYIDSQRSRTKKKRVEKRECLYCKKEFTVDRQHRKYCSELCRQLNYDIQHEEWRLTRKGRAINNGEARAQGSV